MRVTVQILTGRAVLSEAAEIKEIGSGSVIYDIL